MTDATASAPGSVPRRALLSRGMLFLGGLIGAGVAGKVAMGGETSSGEAGPGVVALRLHGANWQATYPDRRRGVLPTPGQRSSVFGELFDEHDEQKLGEFYASSFRFGSPFGPSEAAAGSMELHQFNLADGSLIGVGTVGEIEGTHSVHAIIGGTGRYEGASGSYTAVQRPLELGGDGTADFEFSVILRSA